LWISNPVTFYVYYGTWAHLNGLLPKSPPLVCVSLCVSLISSLGNSSVNAFQEQRIHATIDYMLDTSFSMRSVSYQRGACVSICVSLYHCSVTIRRRRSRGREEFVKASLSMMSV
jgi:hypothetical protein